MNLCGEEMRKFEHVLDVFKGTCELNNYEPMYSKAFILEKPCRDIIKSVLEARPQKERIYFSGPILDGEECVLFGGIRDNDNSYALAEVINLGVKILMNAGLDGISVNIDIEDNEEIISNLEAIDIEVVPEGEDGDSFTIFANDEPLIYGGVCKDVIYFYGDVQEVAERLENLSCTSSLDVYINPMDKETLDDAFVIGSNLRDAGFKAEIDYSLKQVTKDKIDATFLVTFTKDDIEKYRVKLIDMGTKEVKTVMIDNLIEELSFI